MKSDGDLLREFATTHDEPAFAEVVRRHIRFVHAVSLRRMRDSDAAKDATQAVFIALARKAKTVADAPSVVGWLHRSACYQTQYLMRSQKNRVARETEAHRLGTTLIDSRTDIESIGAVLDDVLCELPARDRDAIIDRYFFENSYAAIGAKLQLTENAARMRVDRALQRMRGLLEQRGINSTAAALALALPSYASVPEPSGLAVAIAHASASAAASASTTAAIFSFMSTTKIVTGLAVAAAVAGFVWETEARSALEKDLASTRAELTATNQRMQSNANELAQLQKLQSDLQAKLSATNLSGSSASKIEEAPAVPGVIPKPPKGWIKNGNGTEFYQVGVDENNSWGGMPSAFVKSLGEAGGKFGGMMQTISAEAFRGQRVQLSGWIKTQDAPEGGHLWMRVDGQSTSLQFDNMDGRAPTGTTDWQDYSVVLDVPPEATKLNYGFFVSGKGQVWVNGLTVTKVSNDVPSTNRQDVTKLPTTPVNLGFAATPSSK